MTPATRCRHVGQESLGGAAKATGTPAMSRAIEDVLAAPQSDQQRENMRTERQHGYGLVRERLDPSPRGESRATYQPGRLQKENGDNADGTDIDANQRVYTHWCLQRQILTQTKIT